MSFVINPSLAMQGIESQPPNTKDKITHKKKSRGTF